MSNQPEKDYEELIADQLREAGIKFATEKAIAGLAPDFIVYAPDGRQFIVEVKNWDFPGLTTEASRQAQNYQDAVKADGAFIVIPDSRGVYRPKGSLLSMAWYQLFWLSLKRRRRVRTRPL
jgi:hypothetical protein